MLNLLEDARFPVMLIGLFGCGAPMLRLAIAAPTSVKTTSSINQVSHRDLGGASDLPLVIGILDSGKYQ